MTIKWSGFPTAIVADATDVLVGLDGGTTNGRFLANSFLFKALNLSDVASKTISFNNVSPLTTKGDLIWFDGTNNARLGIGSLNQILSVGASNTITWIDNPGLLIANNLSDVADQTISFNNVSPLTTKGDVIWFDGTNNVRLGVGSLNQIFAVGASNTVGWINNPSLLIANNLSDLNDVAAALVNIGLSPADNVSFSNIFAGSSGSAGAVRSYSSTPSSGYLGLTGVANSGNYSVVISNASHGQSSVYSIPDGGQSTSEFIISDSAGTQHVTSGSIQFDSGAISSGISSGGFSGNFVAYSTTASKGSLRLLSVDNVGDYKVTISNASHGQDSVISIPDSGQATSEFIIADSAGVQHITSGGLQVDEGNLLAGLSAGGTAGSLTLYPATTANGMLKFSAVNAGANFNTTVSNSSSVGQDQVITIPDSGSSTANVILTKNSGIQQIATGSLGLTLGYFRASNANALTAFAGGGQGSALQLSKQINRITTVATTGDSVKLPAALAGMQVTVINAAASNAMDCFPLSGEVINALSPDTALSIAADKTVIFFCAVNGTWNSVVTA